VTIARTAPLPSLARESALLFVLLLALLFPVVFLLYRIYDPAEWPQDAHFFLPMVAEPFSAVGAPHQYRILTPLLVRLIDPLPFFPTEIAFEGDARSVSRYFHYLALNATFVAATGTLLFSWLRTRAPAPWAVLAALFYVLNFNKIGRASCRERV